VPSTAQCFREQRSGSARDVRIGDVGRISATAHLDSCLAGVAASEAKEVDTYDHCVVCGCSHSNV
jgi:hypothetical protein